MSAVLPSSRLLLVAAALVLAPPRLLIMPYPSFHAQSAPAQSPTQAQSTPTQSPTETQEATFLQSANSTTLTPDSAATGLLVVALALSLVAGFFGYKKYRSAQRSRLLKRQVALLEAMWRISSARRKL